MTAHRIPAVLAAALIASLACRGADDAYGDPIPAGAKVRLGTARLRTTGGFGGPTAMTPDGKFLVGVAPAGGIAFSDPATGKTVRTARVDGVFGSPTAFSADGKRAVVGGYGQPVVFDVEAGKVLVKLSRPTPGGDHATALSADGKRFAAGGTKGFDAKDKDKGVTAVVWDVDTNKQVASITPVQNETVYVAMSGDGKTLATWGYHYSPSAKQPPKPEDDPARQIQFWDAAGKQLAKVSLTSGFSATAVALSADGSVAAVSGGDSAIYLFEPATGQAKGLLLGRSRQGRKIVFNPDGKSIASAGEDGYVQVWTVADGKRVATTKSPVPMTLAPRGIQFAGDRVVAWAVRGSAVVVWEAPSGKLLSPAGGHANQITGLAIVAGGKELYTGEGSGIILRWDAATGKELGALDLESSGGSGFGRGVVVLSPDGSRALCQEGGGLAVYDLPAGTQQFVIPGDFNRAVRGAFTADGSKVVQVLSSYDSKMNPGRAAVWDVATGKKIGEVSLPDVSDLSAGLSPDGKMLVTVGVKREDKGNGKIVVTGWEVPTGKKLGEYAEENQGFGAIHVAAAGDNKSAVLISPRDGAVVIDVVAGTKTRALEAPGKSPGGAPVVSPNGKTVAVPTRPGFGATPTYSVLLFDIESGKLKKTLSGLSGSPSSLVFSPDGKTLLTGSTDTTALVWDVGE